MRNPSSRLGQELYRLLFSDRDKDGFANLAEQAWGQPPGCQANTVSVQIELRCDRMPDPWPLTLPWNLLAFQGENLAEHCGWSVEVVATGVSTHMGTRLSSEPPFLLFADQSAEGAQQHASGMNDCLERVFGYVAETQIKHSVVELPECLQQTPKPDHTWAHHE